MRFISTIALLQFLNLCLSSRILVVINMPSPSHHIVFSSYSEALARRGHEVVVLTPSPMHYSQPEYKNITEIDDKGASLAVWNNMQRGVIVNYDILKYYFCHAVKKLIVDMAREQMDHKDARDFFQRTNETFDLVIVQNYATVFLPLAALFKAPLVVMSTSSGLLEDYEAVGNPYNLIIYPDLSSKNFENLNILQKIDTVAFYLCRKFFDWFWNMQSDEILKKYIISDLPKVDEMFAKVSLVFLNVYPLLSHIRPSVPAIIYLGGIHIKESKNLTGDLKKFLDTSDQDVIYMSLGSNAKSMLLSPDKVKAFCSVFSRLPYQIVWKWEKDEFFEKPNNVFTAKWLPQQNLLAHPKVKLFITQAGQQSLEEAVHFEVPLIAMPIVMDQFRLSQRIVQLGIGLSLKMEKLNEQLLEIAIKKIMGNDSYQTNIGLISRLIRDQQESGLDRAIWWTEYVIRHKGTHHLRGPIMSLYEYVLGDVIIVFLSTIILIAAASYLFIKLFIKLFL